MDIGTKLYHIDEPNGIYEILRESPGSTFWYAVYFHPSFGNVKTLKMKILVELFS